jgi:hypothetical protein
VNEDYDKLNTSTLKEEYKRYILIIGGISISLPRILVDASTCVAHEELMEEESREEAIGPNVFKTNSLSKTAGAGEKIQPTKTVMEEAKENTLKSSQEIK